MAWPHFCPKHSWLTRMLLQKMLQICFPLLPLKDFITASLKADINHVAGNLSFRDCTLPLEIPRQGIMKPARFFRLLLLVKRFFHPTFKRLHSPSGSHPTVSNSHFTEELSTMLPTLGLVSKASLLPRPGSMAHQSYRQTSLLFS